MTQATRPLEQQPRAIVIGASSGIGATLVEGLAAAGYQVAALARREARLQELKARADRLAGAERVHIYPHSVTETDVIPALFQQVVADLGGLDLIIYCAGVMPEVRPDEYDFAKDEQMVRVNLLGAMGWLNQAAIRFSRTGSGRIVGISSVSGDRGRRGMPAYHASKGGFSIYLESLRNRLTHQGVSVTTIKPGFVDTEMLASATSGGKFWVISPENAARQIIQAAEKGKQTVYIPRRWGLVMLIIRHIPSIVFRRLSF